MAVEKVEKIWMNGDLIDWDDANVHVLSHVLHYGSSVFEGMRCYKTVKGPGVFRLKDHMRRLLDSARIYRMSPKYSMDELCKATLDLIRVNKLDECYVRPLVYRGYGSVGVDPSGCPVDTCIIVWKWGAYLGQDAIEKGIDVMVSTWNRPAPNTFPSMAKSGANYMNSQLIKMEAKSHGFVEGIALEPGGTISEGSGENIFLVWRGVIYTTPISSSILFGVTRDSVITLAKDMGYEVREERIPREMLYIADEVFFTGSAAEITPIKSVDRIPVGQGTRGPVTKALQEKLFGVVAGKVEKYVPWITFLEG
jgi:branched-chain amino acid aminotransferase